MSMITLERHGPVAVLTLNRPESLNALGAPGDGDQVRAACEEINADQSIRCAVLTGAGRAFSAGGDVKAMKAREGAFGGGGVGIRDNYRTNIHRVVRSIYGLEVPSIAAVNGAAIGLGCDLLLQTPEHAIPGGEAMQALAEAAPKSRTYFFGGGVASRAAFLARRFSCSSACRRFASAYESKTRRFPPLQPQAQTIRISA